MDSSQVFTIANTLALPMWILMVLLPKWKVTNWLVRYRVVPVLLTLVYAYYIIMSMIGGTAFDFGSLASVMDLFTREDAVLAGWVHYLAFDLLVGMWMLEQNKNLGIHQLIMAPCLLLTFMFGPVGFLLFFIIKTVKTSNS